MTDNFKIYIFCCFDGLSNVMFIQNKLFPLNSTVFCVLKSTLGVGAENGNSIIYLLFAFPQKGIT